MRNPGTSEDAEDRRIRVEESAKAVACFEKAHRRDDFDDRRDEPNGVGHAHALQSHLDGRKRADAVGRRKQDKRPAQQETGVVREGRTGQAMAVAWIETAEEVNQWIDEGPAKND